MSEKEQRHAAVRPDVRVGNQRLRTWLWKRPLVDKQAVWIAELDGETRYIRCDQEGRILAYECEETPAEGPYNRSWEEL